MPIVLGNLLLYNSEFWFTILTSPPAQSHYRVQTISVPFGGIYNDLACFKRYCQCISLAPSYLLLLQPVRMYFSPVLYSNLSGGNVQNFIRNLLIPQILQGSDLLNLKLPNFCHHSITGGGGFLNSETLRRRNFMFFR